jgi:CMP-N-acetylneuraminic acid synthetase
MKVVALIPIKLNSERLPRKNIKPFFDGTPLMHFIQRVCLQSDLIDETYVYCSDESVKDCVLEDVKFLKRPAFLDENNMTSINIIKEFVKNVAADIYVETHSTAPFATAASFDTCIKKVVSTQYDSAFCASKLLSFLWQEGKPLNFNPDHFPRTQDLGVIYNEASNAYVFPKDTFLKFGRRVGAKPYIHEISQIEAIDIDEPEDFTIANAIYKDMINHEHSNK